MGFSQYITKFRGLSNSSRVLTGENRAFKESQSVMGFQKVLVAKGQQSIADRYN